MNPVKQNVEKISSKKVDLIAKLTTTNDEAKNFNQEIWSEVEREFNRLSELTSTEKVVKINSHSKNIDWKCNICDKIFKTKYYLKDHLRLHTGMNINNALINERPKLAQSLRFSSSSNFY